MKKAIFLLTIVVSGCSVRSVASDVRIQDVNVFIQNMDTKFTSQDSYFIEFEKLQKIKLGMNEEELFQIIGSKRFTRRHSFNKTLAKRLMKMNYIPVTKKVSFEGFRTKIEVRENSTSYKPQEQLGVTFFFYLDRLIYIAINHREKRDGKWIQLPDSSRDVLYVVKNSETESPIGWSGTNAGGDEKYYGFVNGYLGERFKSSGERYFVPLVPLGKHRVLDFLSDYCKESYYWEAPDYEAELQKSGYYKLKAKLDKDFENRIGYWEEVPK